MRDDDSGGPPDRPCRRLFSSLLVGTVAAWLDLTDGLPTKALQNERISVRISGEGAANVLLERRDQPLAVEEKAAVVDDSRAHAALHRLDQLRVLAADLVVER